MSAYHHLDTGCADVTTDGRIVFVKRQCDPGDLREMLQDAHGDPVGQRLQQTRRSGHLASDQTAHRTIIDSGGEIIGQGCRGVRQVKTDVQQVSIAHPALLRQNTVISVDAQAADAYSHAFDCHAMKSLENFFLPYTALPLH